MTLLPFAACGLLAVQLFRAARTQSRRARAEPVTSAEHNRPPHQPSKREADTAGRLGALERELARLRTAQATMHLDAAARPVIGTALKAGEYMNVGAAPQMTLADPPHTWLDMSTSFDGARRGARCGNDAAQTLSCCLRWVLCFSTWSA